MKLYFFRHGHAEDSQGPDFDDFTRQLTQKGIDRTGSAAAALVKLGVKPARLFSSPRLRARQTADILAKKLGITITVRDEVNFGFSPDQLRTLIAEAGSDNELIFVGHEPDLSILVSALIGGGDIVMKKGGMARVDLLAGEPLRGVLVWMLAPKIFDDIANV